MSINKFSQETIEGIGCYVYRLIDPRNGQTFYVGKGTGNRVFQHAEKAIGYYEGAKDISENDPNKVRIIEEIRQAGLEVLYVIHRWHLDDNTAFEVEAALIDAYQGLSNIQSGHHDEYGVTNAEVLENTFRKPEYNEPDDFKYILIKVQDWKIEEICEKYPEKDHRYEATRSAWRITPKSISEYPFVFSVTDGVVREVYKVHRWMKSDREGRYEFEGEIATDIRNQFINKRIPEKYRKKGMAAPVLFSKN